MELDIKIIGTPEPKQSTRFVKSGFSYQPKKITDYKNTLKYQIISQLPKDFKPTEKPVEVHYQFIFPWLKSHTKKKRLIRGLLKHTKPDTDNLQKAINDALNTVVIIDDSQICKGTFEKIYGDVPGINLIIRSIEQ